MRANRTFPPDSLRTGPIAIDAHMLGTGETGNETYIRGLVSGLRQVATSHDFLLYTTAATRLPAGLAGGQITAREVVPGANVPRLAWTLSRAARRDRVALLHMTYTLPLLAPCPSVVSVHDISYALYPETFSPRDRLLLSLAVPRSLRRARRVLTLSESARCDIIRHYQVPPERIVVTPAAAEDHLRPVCDPEELARIRNRYALPPDYILAVGNLQPRKNLRRLIDAYAALFAAGACRHRLVLVGQPRWRQSELFATIAARGLREQVIATGYVPDADLPALYSGAALFVYPSLYEGFGIPPLEAMACGTPVITSNTSSLPEVVGEAALTVDPTDTAALTRALTAMLTDPALRAHYAALGPARAAQFTWRETARRTLALYEEVLRQSTATARQAR